jgi:hypothetical protein
MRHVNVFADFGQEIFKAAEIKVPMLRMGTQFPTLKRRRSYPSSWAASD